MAPREGDGRVDRVPGVQLGMAFEQPACRNDVQSSPDPPRSVMRPDALLGPGAARRRSSTSPEPNSLSYGFETVPYFEASVDPHFGQYRAPLLPSHL